MHCIEKNVEKKEEENVETKIIIIQNRITKNEHEIQIYTIC